MKIRTILIAAGVSLLIGPISYFFVSGDSRLEDHSVPGSIGNVRALEAAYEKWAAAYTLSGGDQRLVLPLGYSKALSTRYSAAKAEARFDLASGSVTVTARGLPEGESYAAWLVDNQPGPGKSARPEAGDRLLRLGKLIPKGLETNPAAILETNLADVRLDPAFQVDLVVLTPARASPLEALLLAGAPGLFQRLYFEELAQGVFGRSDVLPVAEIAPDGPAARLAYGFLLARPAAAAPGGKGLAKLIRRGEALFFKETFDGNGRTCGSCHPAENNFTIDPAFIATLPDDDPLFVAEFLPALADNFERPELMRQFGLILENTNGFGNGGSDLETNFTMRGVPHTLGLPNSIVGPGGAPRLGWSGDGAPGDGSLRSFATGAVTQHFPKTLARQAGSDFRLPTDLELDAMEAFQLSLGRQEDLDLSELELKGPVPARGQEIFLDDDLGKCNRCHLNAGANASFDQTNRNFNTGVEGLPDQPARLLDPFLPIDDGLGSDPGDGTFNSVALVEAADTGPFFHNNSIETIEGAVSFYNGMAFFNSPSGTGGAFGVGVIDLDGTQVVAVAAFLRVINALENIRSAIELEKSARNLKDTEEGTRLLDLALAESEDAIGVLTAGGLHPEAVAPLREAKTLLESAERFGNLRDIIDLQKDARDAMAFK